MIHYLEIVGNAESQAPHSPLESETLKWTQESVFRISPPDDSDIMSYLWATAVE